MNHPLHLLIADLSGFPRHVAEVLASWFVYPQLLWLLLLLPMLGALVWLAAWRRQKMLAKFGNLFVLRSATTLQRGVRFFRGLFLTLGLILLIIGMAGPQWGYQYQYQTAMGRDIVVVLDVSRSMLAESPSRQHRAKEMLMQLCDWAEQRGGHRLALVVFAGQAKVVCPLTHDYDHFRYMLEQQNAGNLPPELRPPATAGASGTRMGAGLKLAVGLHDTRFEGSQDILMISDGDDPLRDQEWVDGVKAAKRKGIAVDVVGVGDPDVPKWIPLDSGFLEFAGETVETRLEEDPLREIAQQTGGVYIPAKLKTLPLGELYQEVLENRKLRRQEEDSNLPIHQQRYALFLGPALALLVLTMLLGEGRRWQ